MQMEGLVEQKDRGGLCRCIERTTKLQVWKNSETEKNFERNKKAIRFSLQRPYQNIYKWQETKLQIQAVSVLAIAKIST